MSIKDENQDLVPNDPILGKPSTNKPVTDEEDEDTDDEDIEEEEDKDDDNGFFSEKNINQEFPLSGGETDDDL